MGRTFNSEGKAMATTIVQISEGQLWGAEETCRVLQASRESLWRLMQQEGFPAALRFDAGNPRSHLRFRAIEILAWVERQQARSVAASRDGGIHAARRPSARATE